MEIIHPITGRKLSLESFHFDRTYASLVYGSPNLRINTGIIERATYPTNWGKESAFKKIIPDEDLIQKELPNTVYCASFISDAPDSQHCGSSLIILWYDDEPGIRTIKEVLLPVLGKIDWEKDAQNFDY